MVRNGDCPKLLSGKGGGVRCLRFVRHQRPAVSIHPARTIARIEQRDCRIGVRCTIRRDFEHHGAAGYDHIELTDQRAQELALIDGSDVLQRVRLQLIARRYYSTSSAEDDDCVS